MILSQRYGLLVEGSGAHCAATDANHTAGVQHCWIADNRPGSPTLYRVHSKADSLVQAIERALWRLESILKS
jgi:hypothetical protein